MFSLKKCSEKLKSEIAGYFIQNWIVGLNLVMLIKIAVLTTHPATRNVNLRIVYVDIHDGLVGGGKGEFWLQELSWFCLQGVVML